MTCLTPDSMEYFLQTVSVASMWDFPFVTVLSAVARLYVFRDGLYCYDGVSL